MLRASVLFSCLLAVISWSSCSDSDNAVPCSGEVLGGVRISEGYEPEALIQFGYVNKRLSTRLENGQEQFRYEYPQANILRIIPSLLSAAYTDVQFRTTDSLPQLITARAEVPVGGPVVTVFRLEFFYADNGRLDSALEYRAVNGPDLVLQNRHRILYAAFGDVNAYERKEFPGEAIFTYGLQLNGEANSFRAISGLHYALALTGRSLLEGDAYAWGMAFSGQNINRVNIPATTTWDFAYIRDNRNRLTTLNKTIQSQALTTQYQYSYGCVD